MSATATSFAEEFTWEVQPAAAAWVARQVEILSGQNSAIARLAKVLGDQTGTRLTDWIDHLVLRDNDPEAAEDVEQELADAGFKPQECDRENYRVWRQPEGLFPPVLVGRGRHGMAIRVDSLEDALAALPRALDLPAVSPTAVSGPAGGPFRQALLESENGADLWLVERHGHAGFAPVVATEEQISAAAGRLESFHRRQRRFTKVEDGFQYTAQLFAATAAELGVPWACDLFFQAERQYWQSRNRAGQVQFERQNRLGLGWANHDHHTYRSSRRAFQSLIEILEMMGFQCRERFYAGREAGWGAQVIEQPECGVVIFADVDLSPDEVLCDFAHEPLSERDALGTVGLWCELHGEAFFEAGMHHLECQFDFEAARSQLQSLGVESLAPFTNFPFLRQAFTRGETWPVDPQRIERLAAAGRISAEQAERFRREGAIGSHLEVLERNDGYKGFNQTGISDIITRTDPRRVVGA
jgi:hypothetical protein